MTSKIDKLKQAHGYDTSPKTTPQIEVETKPVAQPIDMTAEGANKPVPMTAKNQPIDMTSGKTTSDRPMVEISSQPQEKVIYSVKRGDTLWNLAKETLVNAGIEKPNNTQIVRAMEAIAKNNGCDVIKDFTSKFFNRIGSEIDMTGLTVIDGILQYVEPVKSQPVAESTVLSEEEEQLLQNLKSKYPDLELDKMSDSEVKKMLDNFKESKPELFADNQPAEAPQVESEGEKEVPKFIQEYFGEKEITQEAIVSEDFKTKMMEYMKNAPDVEAAQLAKYIVDLSPEVDARVIASPGAPVDDMRSAIEEYVAANPTAIQSKPAVVPKSELEELAEKTGIDGDIDKILEKVKGKSADELTHAEAEFLNKYNAFYGIETKENVQTDTDLQSKQILIEIARKVYESGILNKSNEEKVQMLSQLYLATDKTYQDMSEDKKIEKFAKTVELLTQLSEPASKVSESVKGLRALAVFGMVKSNGISLEELQDMPKDKREAMLKDFEAMIVNDYIDIIKNKIEIDGAGNLSGKQKLNKYVDTILSIMDKDYSNLSAKEKDKRIKENINDIASKFGFKDVDYDNAPEIVIQKMLNMMEGAVKYSRKEGISIIDVMTGFPTYSRSIKNRIEGYAVSNIKYDEAPPIMQESIDRYRCSVRIFEVLEGDKPSNYEALAKIKELLEHPVGFTDPQIKLLESWKISVERLIQMNQGDSEFIPPLSNADWATVRTEGTPEGQEVVDVRFNGELTKENFESEEMLVLHKDFLERATADELDNYIAYCRKIGISDAKINAMIHKYVSDGKLLQIASLQETSQEMTGVIKIGKDAGIEQGTSTILRHVPGWDGEVGTNEAVAGYIEIVAEDKNLTRAAMDGAYEYKSPDDVIWIASSAANSDNVSEAGRANICYTAVVAAPDDDTKLYVGGGIAESTDNASALEGLAAASSSISDSDKRNQYNSYIDNAASNLPPEDKSRIETAKQTGEISQETQSKTSSNSSSSSQETSENKDTKKSAKTESKSQDKAEQTKAQDKKAKSAQQTQNQQSAKTTQAKDQKSAAQGQTQPKASQTVQGQTQSTTPKTAATSQSTQASQHSSQGQAQKTSQISASSQAPTAATKAASAVSSDASAQIAASSASPSQAVPSESAAASAESVQNADSQSTITSAESAQTSGSQQSNSLSEADGTSVATSGMSDVLSAENSGASVQSEATASSPSVMSFGASGFTDGNPAATGDLNGIGAQGVSATGNAAHSEIYTSADQIIQGMQNSEAFRAEVLAKIEQFQSDIRASIEEWENRHRRLPVEEGDIVEYVTAGIAIDAAVEAINSSSLNENEKKVLFEQVAKASSINEIYEILITRAINLTSIKEKVIDLIGRASSSERVKNVVTELINADDSVVKELYKRSSSSSIKKELLKMMSPDTVVELLESKQIKNIGDVEPKFLIAFLEKNIYSMSNVNFTEYLSYLSIEDRNMLVALRNKEKNNITRVVVPTGEAHTADMVTPAAEDDDSQNPGHAASDDKKPVFSAGQISMKQGDKIITQVGTTFVVENANQFDSEEPEYGTYAAKEKYDEPDTGMIALNNEDDLNDFDPLNRNYSSRSNRVPFWKEPRKRPRGGIFS